MCDLIVLWSGRLYLISAHSITTRIAYSQVVVVVRSRPSVVYFIGCTYVTCDV